MILSLGSPLIATGVRAKRILDQTYFLPLTPPKFTSPMIFLHRGLPGSDARDLQPADSNHGAILTAGEGEGIFRVGDSFPC